MFAAWAMLVAWVVSPPVVAVGSDASPSPATAPDSMASHRIVRQFEPLEVLGGRFQDPRSSEAVHTIPASALAALPVDRFADAVALQPGVVAVGEDLHVRGGRTGDLAVSVAGLPLNEPRRGRPLELPLFAIESADLLTGGLDADHTGALAGELDVRTIAPTRRPSARLRWLSDGRRTTGYDGANAALTGPLVGGLGFALAAQGTLDDLGLPALRTRGRSDVLGSSFGWRADNHMLGFLRLAPVSAPGRASLQLFGSRIVQLPYDPMFSYDGWVTPAYPGATPDAWGVQPLVTSRDSLNPSSYRYDAADHLPMTDERRLAAVLSFAGGDAKVRRSAALSWERATSLTSVGLQPNHAYVEGVNAPVWAGFDTPYADPFHIYGGNDPYWQSSGSVRWQARADIERALPSRQRLRFGAGASYDEVWLSEVESDRPIAAGVDTLRAYHAFAPGGWAYFEHRWDYEGMSWNAGLRTQIYTPGPQARGSGHTSTDDPGLGHVPTDVSWSPRLGLVYSVSDHDVFSLAYTRIDQDPARDFLYDNRVLNYDRWPHGDALLSPEAVTSWQASARHLFDPVWSAQASVFERDVSHAVGARTVWLGPSTYRLEYTNDDQSQADGFELTLTRERRGHSRIEVAYTFMHASGTQSTEEGTLYGAALAERPAPLDDRPLDWDVRQLLSLSGDWRRADGLQLSWSTHVESGLPWTPQTREPAIPFAQSLWIPAYMFPELINSERLSWSETTNLSVHFPLPVLKGARVLLQATNLFDNRADRLAAIDGYPNPFVNTLYDEYEAYRTETGQGGGGYWSSNGTSARAWTPVNDPRLSAPPRSLRAGIELGL